MTDPLIDAAFKHSCLLLCGALIEEREAMIIVVYHSHKNLLNSAQMSVGNGRFKKNCAQWYCGRYF